LKISSEYYLCCTYLSSDSGHKCSS